MALFQFHASYCTPAGFAKTWTRDIEADSLQAARARGSQKLHHATRHKELRKLDITVTAIREN